MRKTALLVAPFAAMTLLTGCADPCAGLKPTAQDKIVFENGGEVDREGKRGADCEASRETDGKFVRD